MYIYIDIKRSVRDQKCVIDQIVDKIIIVIFDDITDKIIVIIIEQIFFYLSYLLNITK